MNTIEKSGFTKWCTNKGLEIADREWPIYKSTEPLSFLIKLPDNPYRGVALARMCFPGRVNSPFKGAMVWFREWGVWNKVDEETGMQTVQRLRAALGETRPLIEAPGHLFSVQEFPDARAFWNEPTTLFSIVTMKLLHL